MSPHYSFPKQASTCPVCKNQSVVTIESHTNQDDSRRRRKHCIECNRRHTTYEVSEDFYKTAVSNKKTIDKITKCLNLNGILSTTDEPDTHFCDDCVYMHSYGCDFEFPDAGGTFANECSMFKLNKA